MSATDQQNIIMQRYLDKLNLGRTPFGERALTLPLSDDDANSVFKHLECSLSPEMLNEDGEISRKEAQRKLDFLLLVWSALMALTGIERTHSYH
jgi:hypothetical protein